ncbi:hypothetical protein GO755_24670 [Spirosoma sp. HMF4905]|uniref:Uncharacterized protein n=1 Tax=Spirosoma arboris TaxID=2682092 RepID=A0A7K1SHG8_9BACT|nr:hypothetical protein [Spirosoma arboris]MVM33257.1 hypothetical protein [Spirosoma arboris]
MIKQIHSGVFDLMSATYRHQVELLWICTQIESGVYNLGSIASSYGSGRPENPSFRLYLVEARL